MNTWTIGDMRLSDIHINYTMPNFEVEYEEMTRYPELQHLSVEQWVDLCKTGKAVRFTEPMLAKLNNTEAVSIEDAKRDFGQLEKDKRQRFQLAFKSGQIEMPIVIKMNGKYELLAGNTRATGLVAKGIMPKMWVVDIE